MSFSMNAPVGGGSFELAPVGTHNARLIQLIDQGEQDNKYKPGTMIRKIRLGWELVDTAMEDGRPFMQSKPYTYSVNAKSTLRKDLKNMTGKGMTDDEARQLDLTKILGMPCQIVISHDEYEGKDYANIQAFIPADKANKPKAAENPTLLFSTEHPDMDVYAKIPEWIQNKINLKEGSAPVSTTHQAKDSPVEDDDIPW